MKLNELMKLQLKSKKRIGRGLGSGKGKTGGRGTKGQKARGKMPLAAVGGGLILYKKLPFRRGLGNRKVSPKSLAIKLSDLAVFKNKEVVDLESLIAKGLVKEKQGKRRGVKILTGGEVKVALVVKVPISAKAKELIEKMGGKVV